MKREVKFRGFSIEDQMWVFGDLLQYRVLPVIFNEHKEQHEVDARSVGQYTGLKDKTWIEIYEGDIIEIDYSTLAKMEIIFVAGSFVAKTPHVVRYLHEASGNEIEIIGNVYEHPHLIK